MSELLIRGLIGGVVVSVFAALADMFQPKSFAGLFGAAPSIALTTLALAILNRSARYAAIEAHSMIAGSIAFFIYAWCVSWVMMKHNWSAMLAASSLLCVWIVTAFGLWFIWFR